MERKVLGRTQLDVTQLGYGAMELRGPKFNGRPVTESVADEILNAVLDAGINFIDTSPDYGDAEEHIGRAVSGRREEYFLATKCGCDPARREHVWAPDQLMWNIETSLERMKTDHVDILQLHNPFPSQVRNNELVDALTKIQSQGMTRFIGISTTEPSLSEFLDMGVFDTFQIPYSCLQPEHHEAITRVGEAGHGVIIRGGIGMGGPASAVPDRVPQQVWDDAELDELCEQEAIPAPELILRYTLSHPHCHTTIVGTQSPDHMADNLAAANRGPLPEKLYHETMRRVKKALAL